MVFLNLLVLFFYGFYNSFYTIVIIQLVQAAILHFKNLKMTETDGAIGIAIGCGLTVIITILGATKVGQRIASLFFHGRNAVSREFRQIDPLINEVIESINKKHGTRYERKNIKLIMVDDKTLQASAFGHSTLIVFTGILQTLSDEEIKGVLAHEFGHLFYRDSVFLTVLAFSSIFTGIFFLPWNTFIKSVRDAKAKGEDPGFMRKVLIALLFCFYLVPLIIDFIIQNLVRTYLLLTSRFVETRSDIFSAELGYGEGLIGYLEKIQMMTSGNPNFFERFFTTHPEPMKRIDRLEKAMAANLDQP